MDEGELAAGDLGGEAVLQECVKTIIEFAGDDPDIADEQFVGQDARAGADFEGDFALLNARNVDEFSDKVVIDEEILAKRLLRGEAPGGQKVFD